MTYTRKRKTRQIYVPRWAIYGALSVVVLAFTLGYQSGMIRQAAEDAPILTQLIMRADAACASVLTP